MRLRTGLIIGAAIGYVMGAKAGRQRYEELRRLWDRTTRSAAVQRATGKTMEVAGESARKGLTLVQQGVEKAGSAVKSRLHYEDEVDRQTERLIDLVDEPSAQPRTAGEAFGSDAGRGDYSK